MNNKEKLYLAKTAFEFRDSLKSFAEDNPRQVPKIITGLGGASIGGFSGGALGCAAGMLAGALKDPDEEKDESRLGNAAKWGLGGIGLGGLAGAGLGGYMGYNSTIGEIAGDKFKELQDRIRQEEDKLNTMYDVPPNSDISIAPGPTTMPADLEYNDFVDLYNNKAPNLDPNQ